MVSQAVYVVWNITGWLRGLATRPLWEMSDCLVHHLLDALKGTKAEWYRCFNTTNKAELHDFVRRR